MLIQSRSSSQGGGLESDIMTKLPIQSLATVVENDTKEAVPITISCDLLDASAQIAERMHYSSPQPFQLTNVMAYVRDLA
jgi:hypothetical protein